METVGSEIVSHYTLYIKIYDTFGTTFYSEINISNSIFDRLGTRNGYPIGIPTVKELIAILQKLPEDYRVYCCGGENYLYLWANKKSITIDCERYLG